MVGGYNNEPRPISGLKRYYHDVYYAGGQSINTEIALDTLLANLPADISLTAQDMYDADFISQQLECDLRAANEHLALLPLYYIGPELDASNCSIEELQQWYTDAVKGLFMVADKMHSELCYEAFEGTTQHYACAASAICPRRFLQGYLLGGVLYPDFTNVGYIVDPTRKYLVETAKLAVATANNIVMPVFSEASQVNYDAMYMEYLNTPPENEG